MKCGFLRFCDSYGGLCRWQRVGENGRGMGMLPLGEEEFVDCVLCSIVRNHGRCEDMVRLLYRG